MLWYTLYAVHNIHVYKRFGVDPRTGRNLALPSTHSLWLTLACFRSVSRLCLALLTFWLVSVGFRRFCPFSVTLRMVFVASSSFVIRF